MSLDLYPFFNSSWISRVLLIPNHVLRIFSVAKKYTDLSTIISSINFKIEIPFGNSNCVKNSLFFLQELRFLTKQLLENVIKIFLEPTTRYIRVTEIVKNELKQTTYTKGTCKETRKKEFLQRTDECKSSLFIRARGSPSRQLPFFGLYILCFVQLLESIQRKEMYWNENKQKFSRKRLLSYFNE